MTDTQKAEAAAKKAGKKKVKKAPAKKNVAAKKPAAAKTANEDKGDASQIGHNSRIPTKAEMEGYFGRLDAVLTQKRESNARYMTDIKNIYEEAANKLGSSRKIMRRLYAEKMHAESYRDFIEELEPKERDDNDRLTLGAAKAFGDDTPFGTFLKSQIESRGSDEADHDEVPDGESEVVQRARESIEAGERSADKS